MAANYSLVAEVSADARDFHKKMDGVKEKLGNVGDNLKDVGSSLKKVGGKLTKSITVPALAAGTALAGVTLKKGWSRVNEIDEAKAKMKALGEDSTLAMKHINNAVTDTAFGLGEASTVATSAFASGVKNGKDLETHLKRIGDVATIAGAEFGEIGYIFNKVSASGRVTNQELMELETRGVGASDALAKHLGVTRGEVRKMAADGAIDFETFSAAMDEAFGGSAQTAGKTLRATLKNIGASLGRVGANFLGAADDGESFIGRLIPLLTDFKNDKLKGLEEQAKAMGAVFGQVFGAIISYFKEGNTNGLELSSTAEKIFSKIEPLLSLISRVSKAFSGMSTDGKIAFLGIALGAGPALTILGKMSSGLSDVIKGFGKFTGHVGGAVGKLAGLAEGFMGLSGAMKVAVGIGGILAAAFVLMFLKNEEFRKGVGKLIGSLKDALAPAIANIKKSFEAFHEAMAPIVQTLESSLMPVFDAIGNALVDIMGSLAPVVALLVDNLLVVIVSIAEALAPVIEALAPALITVIQAISEVIISLMPVIESIIVIVTNVITSVIAIVKPVITFIAYVISAIMQIIIPIKAFIANVVINIIAIITGIIAAVTTIFSTVFRIVSEIFTGINRFIGQVINSIAYIIGGLVNVVSKVFGIIGRIISKVFTGIQSAWSGLTGFVSGVCSGINGAFDSLVSGVKGAVNIVTRGINSAISIINKIPGVSISRIPQLYRGTDNWQGGFAAMNEGGRGEMVYLPNGAQVIPHDISVKYAKEAARGSTGQMANSNYDRRIDDIYNLLNRYIPSLGNMDVVMDSGALVGQIAPGLDMALGKMSSRRRRG